MKLKHIPKQTYNYSLKIFNSIAFYPAVVVSILIALSFLIIYLEQADYIRIFVKSNSYLWVSGIENAREIISILIAGLISLTVFSFSMVMIVLTQASTTFSPRIIPGLISKKSHQIILGFYLGTIIYFLILLHSIYPTSSDETLPKFGIFIGEILGLTSLILFVYFIHAISKQIQIDNIIQGIISDTSQKLNNKREKDIYISAQEFNFKWYPIYTSASGYYKNFEEKKLLQFADKNNSVVKVLHKEGTFLMNGYPIAEVNNELSDEKIEELLDYFILDAEEFRIEGYLYGLKQLTEVAVKALSPGINDPGTALKIIDQFTILFSGRINYPEYRFIRNKENIVRIIEKSWSFNDIIYRFLTPIRTYGCGDIFIVTSLLDLLNALLFTAKQTNADSSGVKNYIKIVLDDADSNIKNPADRKIINKKIEEINYQIGSANINLLSI